MEHSEGPGSQGPATVRAHQARLTAWADLDNRYGTLTAGQVETQAGHPGTDLATTWEHQQRIIAMPLDGPRRYPTFQFTPTGTPIPALQALIAAFRTAEWDDESVLLWFTAPNGYLNTADPASMLSTDPSHVQAAARSAAANS